MVSIATACQQKAGLNANVVIVIADREDAAGIAKAQQLGLKTAVVPYKQFGSRAQFEAALVKQIDQATPDVVILAGFMRILSPTTVAHYADRMLNIHPSLLPKFPGLHTHKQVLEAGDAEHGATVHEVTAVLDHGPIIAQARVPVLVGDTEALLAARVLEQELLLYPRAIAQWLGQQTQKVST